MGRGHATPSAGTRARWNTRPVSALLRGMARVEIELPDAFAFATEVPVRIDDVNYGGHLGNDAVLAIAQEARLRFLAANGYASELDVGGVGLVMADAAVGYRAEGRWGMVLKVAIAVSDLRTRGFDMLYRMTDAADGTEIARGSRSTRGRS